MERIVLFFHLQNNPGLSQDGVCNFFINITKTENMPYMQTGPVCIIAFNFK